MVKISMRGEQNGKEMKENCLSILSQVLKEISDATEAS